MSTLTPEEIQYEMEHINDNRGYQQIIPLAIFGIVALICVILRPIARKSSRIVLGLDDYLIIASMFFGIGLVITGCLTARYGVGKHIIAVSMDDLIHFGKTNFALQLFYAPCLSLAKLSILALYHRIFRISGKAFNWAIYTIAVWIILWFIGVYLAILLGCHPIHTYWTASCAPTYTTSITTSVTNIISDIAVLLLPQAQVWGLQMPIRKKIGLSIVFLMGLLATAMSIARIPILRAGNQGGSPDLTYNLVMTYVFTVLEPMLAIICACLPVMQGLFIKGMASGFGMSSLRSLLRSNKGDSTQGSKQNWSKIQASGASAGTNVSTKSVDVHSMEVPLRDEEQGYYEMSNAPVKKSATSGVAQ